MIRLLSLLLIVLVVASTENTVIQQEKISGHFSGTRHALKSLWLGCYTGLYGTGWLDKRPTEECFGDWISENLEEVNVFAKMLVFRPTETTFEESKQVAYDIVDLMFLNDEYCLFRSTLKDLDAYCNLPSKCRVRDVADRFKARTVELVIDLTLEVFKALLVFKDESWSEMDIESRGVVLTTISHSFTQIIADIFDIRLPLQADQISSWLYNNRYIAWKENIPAERIPQNAIYDKTMHELESIFYESPIPDKELTFQEVEFDVEIRVE